MKNYAIYKGVGASPTNASLLRQVFSEALYDFGADIRFITEHDLNDPAQKWRDKTDVLVIGGGAYGLMKAATTPEARQGIYDFAQEKTTAGICMGGYGLSLSTAFTGEGIVKSSDGIAAYNGHAVGALDITPARYNGNSNSMRIITLHHEKYGFDFPAPYWGGPSFHTVDPDDTRIETIVTLKLDNHSAPVALGVRVRHDQGGTTVLAGYHSEATKPAYISSWVGKFKSSDEDFERVEREIAEHPTGKYYLGFAALLDDINAVPDHSFVQQIMGGKRRRNVSVFSVDSSPSLQPA